MMEFVNGVGIIPYMKWKINNVWNHQPAYKMGCNPYNIPSGNLQEFAIEAMVDRNSWFTELKDGDFP